MLKIDSLNVKVDEKTVINNLNFDFELGKNYAILGKNGTGKSSLFFTIMGHPFYKVNSGTIYLDGENLLQMTPDQRSSKGIFLAFQNVPEIPGIKLFEFLKMIYNSQFDKSKQLSFMKFKKLIEPIINELGISKDFLFRDLNVGFSGGEKRKLELLQIKLLKPKYILLDEIDSGLDVNSLHKLGDTIKSICSSQTSFIIISHYFDIYNYIDIDKTLIIQDGNISQTGGKDLIQNIKNNGFK